MVISVDVSIPPFMCVLLLAAYFVDVPSVVRSLARSAKGSLIRLWKNDSMLSLTFEQLRQNGCLQILLGNRPVKMIIHR